MIRLRFAKPHPHALSVSALALTVAVAAASVASAAPQNWQEYSPGPPTPGTYPADSATSHNNNFGAVRYANPSAAPGSNAEIIEVWKLNAAGVPAGPLATIGGGTMKSGSLTNPFAPLIGYQPSDRIEMTNTRAVSIGSGQSPLAPGSLDDETYIEITDLVPMPPGSPPALLVPQWVITPTPGGYTTDHAGYANDVAITRDGAYAVVNSDNWIHVIDASTGAIAAAFNIGGFDFSVDPEVAWVRPCTPNRAVDSVEMTDKVAVVIADWRDPNTGLFWWNVDVWSVSPTTGLMNLAKYIDPNFNVPGEPESHSHDLAIDKDFDKAVVRTSFDNVIVTSITSPPPTHLAVASPNSSDAYAYEGFRFSTGYDVFSSDSVVIAPDPDLTLNRVTAATIGGHDVSGVFHGYVDIIDLSATPPVLLLQVDIASASPLSPGCVPLDIALAFNHTEVVIRSADPYVDPPLSTIGADVVRVSLLAPFGFNFKYGGHGTVMGLDSLAAPVSGIVSTAKRVLSISQEPGTPSGPGYLHIAH